MILNVKNGVGVGKDFTLSKEFIDELYEQDDVIVPFVEHMRHRATAHSWGKLLPFLEKVAVEDEELNLLKWIKELVGNDTDFKSLYFEYRVLKGFYNAPVKEIIDGEYAILKRKKGGTYKVDLSDRAKMELEHIDTNDDNWCEVIITENNLFLITHLYNNRLEMVDSWG